MEYRQYRIDEWEAEEFWKNARLIMSGESNLIHKIKILVREPMYLVPSEFFSQIKKEVKKYKDTEYITLL